MLGSDTTQALHPHGAKVAPPPRTPRSCGGGASEPEHFRPNVSAGRALPRAAVSAATGRGPGTASRRTPTPSSSSCSSSPERSQEGAAVEDAYASARLVGLRSALSFV